MIHKIILTEEQKRYLILYYDLSSDYLKKHLELIRRENKDNWPWELCTGSKTVGMHFNDHVVEELTASLESKIKYSEIAFIGKSGDKLLGKFYLDIPGITNPRKSVPEIVLLGNIEKLLRNGDIYEGARYFQQKQLDGNQKLYVIVKP